jgi:hypothetical protein
MNVGPLARAKLAEAELVLSASSAFDRATDDVD